MSKNEIHAVTGAFGYSGKYIASLLLDQGHKVITLTNSINRKNSFKDKIKAYPFNFNDPDKLTESLKDVIVLYITYWVRFNYKTFSYKQALQNTITLFDCAKKAGVERIVYVSITNPSENSHLEYFSGKAKIEKALKKLGISYAILRPAVLFGKEDILINNIAWALRRFPIFPVFGDGNYKLQPIYVKDLAELIVEQGKLREDITINAIGPETFTYRELAQVIGSIIGKKRPILSVPPSLGFLASKVIDIFINDVLITWEEIDGLMSNLLYVTSTPTAKTKLTEWAKDYSDTFGRKYTSELARRTDRISNYDSN